ncbi:hypothetical protein ACFS6H_13540 [Terrimonas rubra]|uniref:Uncharacterized protein n=1 Tax=Terrimonas rubra TaxID=1035890 RepID=A0ABW6A7L2_9BACT
MKLIIVLLLLSLLACNNPNNSQHPASKNDSVTTFTVTTPLRPGENIVLNQPYTDTLEFIKFNDDGDYYLCFVKKNTDTIGLIYDSEYHFVRGDEIAITWKMDSIRYAGDSEVLDYTAFLVAAKRIKGLTLTDKNISFLSGTKKYDATIKDSLNTMVINEAYCKTITDPEKAALAYVATFVGNECSWDGQATPERSNLKCKILSALDLGYQCSHTHLDFLKYWFRKDNTVLQELQNCPTTPDGATIQDSFKNINITTKGNTINITYTVEAINIREGKSWSWTETDQFRFDTDQLQLIKKDKSAVKETSFVISGN